MESLQTTEGPNAAPLRTPAPDPALIEAAANGDPRAFETIFVRYQRRLKRRCIWRGLSPDEADDVSQDVFVKVYRNLHRYEHQNAFETWLNRVTDNACIDYCRQRQRGWAIFQSIPTDEDGKEWEPPGRFADPEEQLQADGLGARIVEALESLSPQLRQPFEMRELEGLRYAQIAARLGVNVGTVKSRLYRARQLLTQQLRAQL